jgi:predicted ABC-type transport system involved in lysophospholipase L1 biosynthesis ATPase subunit
MAAAVNGSKPPRANPLIRLHNVDRTYDDGAIVALKKIDLVIATGECVAILGPSGSGKSSLLNILSGIDAASGGEVLWNDLPPRSRREWASLRGTEIGIVFQEFNLLPTLTAIENVEMALLGRGISAATRRMRSVKALERVGLIARLDHLPSALSGGERQRVAIARSIVNAPSLLLADEPTGNLDSANASLVIDLLLGLQDDTGMTLVLITHDENLAARCGRCVRMKDGEVVEDRLQTPRNQVSKLELRR